MTRLCSVSVDVDPIPCYYRIHGLGPCPDELRETVMAKCIPRFADLFDRHGIRGTFFIVGEDVDTEALGRQARVGRDAVAGLVASGHEIGSHSYSHPYDMARLSRDRVAEEIGLADELLTELAGEPLRGFRAPGYDISGDMLEELARRGYQYDSSIFPAPGYYAAKAVVMAALRVVGRPSGSVMTSPRALIAPTDPYRPAPRAPWRRGQATLVELPIAVTPFSRLPVIGTSVLLAPEPVRRALLGAMERRWFFNLELHGLDLCDADADGIPPELCARQPDLRAPLDKKLHALEATLEHIARSYEFAPLRDVASYAQRVS